MPRMWPLVWTLRDRALYVVFAASVRERLAGFLRADAGTLEAGGILLGLRRDPHLEVLEATLPGRHDLRYQQHFMRRCRSHQSKATAAWRDSGQTIDYLGEWHTHPATQHPLPSMIDRCELIRRSREHRDESLVELIIGTRSLWSGMVIAGRYVRLTPICLSPTGTDDASVDHDRAPRGDH